MKFNLLPIKGKAVWNNNKPFLRLVLSLILVYSVLKIIFYLYNHQLLFTASQPTVSAYTKWQMISWSLFQDLLTILAINCFLLFGLTLGRLLNPKFSAWIVVPVFVLINSFAILLNLVDIFYYRFHFQRVNADLLYVLDHPLNRLGQQNIFVIIGFLLVFLAILFMSWVLIRKLFNSFLAGQHCRILTAALFICIGLPLAFKHTFTKYLVPTYPMVDLTSNQLVVVQNSFHTFIFSVFRTAKGIPRNNFMSGELCDSLMPIRKKFPVKQPGIEKKNIVLFIMESVPYDFFDSSGKYKVDMPFFDSIIKKSSFFSNAFSYAHESNKGIAAILAGIPTITDIPVYHSQYTNMPITPIGTALKSLQYKSFFCIGDEYDNFGFAKCMNWLGIDNYYSKEDIPDSKRLPAHSMGIHDEYVLDFFRQKISEQKGPFFGIHYNISTHYPYSLPASYIQPFPKHYTAPMKSMRYYDHSLQLFFNAVRSEPWFANTLFIFCSDHWLVPDDKDIQFNAMSGYRIPIIIYDAAESKQTIINKQVSQFDILGTILTTAGYQDSVISYGGNLRSRNSIGTYTYSKPGSNLYQITDSSFVLGYNIIKNKVEYLYNYKKDRQLKTNLVNEKNAGSTKHVLTRQIKAFLQKAYTQYNSNPFK